MEACNTASKIDTLIREVYRTDSARCVVRAPTSPVSKVKKGCLRAALGWVTAGPHLRAEREVIFQILFDSVEWPTVSGPGFPQFPCPLVQMRYRVVCGKSAADAIQESQP